MTFGMARRFLDSCFITLQRDGYFEAQAAWGLADWLSLLVVSCPGSRAVFTQ